MSTTKSTSSEILDGLKPLVRGALLTPADAGYEDSRKVWNGMIDRHPAAVVRCHGTSDVLACVNFAREQGLVLCIKGGGHNIAGLAVSDGALLLDMSGMRGVFVDSARKVAHCQAGCTLGDVDRETQLYGLAACLGFVSNTGIAGLTLGGGFGYMSRRFGWTTDTVKSMTVVTADGRIVRASESENSDLFWGLCGGGGNFGVVTDIEYELFEVGPEIVGGAIAWPADQANEVLALFAETVADMPRELALVAGLRKAPPAPWLSPDVHGKPIILVVACYTGPIEQGEKLLAPIKAFGAPAGDVIQRRPYVTQQSLLDATQPNGRRYYWKSEYLPGVASEMLEIYKQQGAKIQSPHSALLLFPLGGAVQELPDGHSAAGNRAAGFVFNATASWEDASEDATHIGWARETWQALKPFSTGGTYLNFLTEDEGDERVRDALGENYDRLVEIKTKWDPTNLFRANKNIAPRT